MKRLAVAILLLLILPIAASSQIRVTRTALFRLFDLDGTSASAARVISANILVDNGTSVASANYTILAQPDVCRKLDLTIVDTDLTAGTITVNGLGCLGESRTCSFAFTAGSDTGVKQLTCTDGNLAYFSSVTTVTTGVMTGESDETFSLGYTTNSAKGWPVAGVLKPVGPNGERGVNPFGFYEVPKRITTAGASSTTVTDVNGADDAFALVNVGDLLTINVQGIVYQRVVTAKASADSITVDQTITIPAVGVGFKFKKLYFSTNPADDMSFSVKAYKTLNLNWSVDAVVATGGVVTSFECSYDSPSNPGAVWQELNTITVATGTSQAQTTENVDLTALPFSRCRFGLRFGTGDDADAAPEIISADVVLMQ